MCGRYRPQTHRPHISRYSYSCSYSYSSNSEPIRKPLADALAPSFFAIFVFFVVTSLPNPLPNRPDYPIKQRIRFSVYGLPGRIGIKPGHSGADTLAEKRSGTRIPARPA